MKMVIVAVHTTGEFDDSMSCNYGIFDFDELKAAVSKFVKIAAKLSKSEKMTVGLEMYLYEPAVVSFGTAEKLVGKKALNAVDTSGEGFSIVSVSGKAFDLACSHEERTDCNMTHIGEDDLYWSFFPKHTTISCETVRLPVSVLK